MEAASPTETFETFIAKERERLQKKREDLRSRQKKTEEELNAVSKELFAIDAYEAAKKGKLPSQRKGGSRAPRGELRAKIISCVTGNGNGLTRGEILESLGMKGDDAGERSVSSALAVMKKNMKLKQDDSGRYSAA